MALKILLPLEFWNHTSAVMLVLSTLERRSAAVMLVFSAKAHFGTEGSFGRPRGPLEGAKSRTQNRIII